MNKIASIMLLVLVLLIFTAPAALAGERILCASTTSTQNSGLFDHILPMFEKRTGIRVHVVAVGTGAAIGIGKRGDADVVLVHARDLELEAVSAGFFTDRRDVMHNDFVIIGPDGDPAGVLTEKTAARAFTNILESSSPFISRGDGSGTHRMEMSIWREAGLNPQGGWYMEVGQGMAKTQRIANEKRAYTLTDRGTWLSRKDRIEMSVLLEGDPALINQYGVMAVSPKMHKHVRYTEALAFINWLTSDEGQRAIASFRDERGNMLFTPGAISK
jgi:tungstate transport system substrate-binding protein